MDRISEVTRECFDAVIGVRRADPTALPAPAALHRQLRRFMDQLLTRAGQAGFSREDADDIAYAVAALADEVVASRSEALGEFWSGHALQLEYFRDAAAGDAFFDRLERVRKDPRRREVLQAYAVALLLGFQGRYRVRGGELELLGIVEDVGRDLVRGRRHDVEVLSPRGERPEDGRAMAGGARRAPWIAGAVAVASALLLYAGLHAWLGFRTDAALGRIAATAEGR